jgi:hypothetical protein
LPSDALLGNPRDVSSDAVKRLNWVLLRVRLRKRSEQKRWRARRRATAAVQTQVLGSTLEPRLQVVRVLCQYAVPKNKKNKKTHPQQNLVEKKDGKRTDLTAPPSNSMSTMVTWGSMDASTDERVPQAGVVPNSRGAKVNRCRRWRTSRFVRCCHLQMRTRVSYSINLRFEDL